MNKIKLPESFQNLSLDKLIALVDLFVYQNKSYIPKKQLYNWNTKDQVPTLFLEFVKLNGFSFKENSAAIKMTYPPVGLLVSLVKKGEQIVKTEVNSVSHIGRYNSSKKNIHVNEIMKIPVHRCQKDDCVNNNSKICSCSPFKPTKKEDIIIDCLRYSPKDFKFKHRDEALIVYSDWTD